VDFIEGKRGVIYFGARIRTIVLSVVKATAVSELMGVVEAEFENFLRGPQVKIPYWVALPGARMAPPRLVRVAMMEDHQAVSSSSRRVRSLD